ncbi:transposase [Streptomyces inhibens]|uniref:transposase n=1 Tax=Streptomyces inhibens TaxID=2293571 RepID=UPI003CC9C9AB|nr:transposase [Streptomyces inhibens]
MGDTGFPKDGISSPDAARQYSGTLGKVGNCQMHQLYTADLGPVPFRVTAPGRSRRCPCVNTCWLQDESRGGPRPDARARKPR